MAYERRGTRPIPFAAFVARMVRHSLVSGVVLLGSLAVGMAGYEYYESLAWRDAFLNAAMLLGGMGPVNDPVTDAGKIFAGLYALYAGLVFLVVVGILLAPVIHRIQHHFHWQGERS